MKKYLLMVVAMAFLPTVALAYDSMTPEVRVFNNDFSQAASFPALDGKFTGGEDVAVADVDGDGTDEIIVAAGRGGAPMVQIFNGSGKLLRQFNAYPTSMTAGVKVAAGDLNGDGKAEIVTGTEYGGGPYVRIFNGDGTAKFTPGFFAFDSGFRGGVDVTVGDFNGDGKREIAASAGPTGSPHVREFDRTGRFLGTEFRPFAGDNTGGVAIASANVDGGDDDELVMSIFSAGEAWVKVYKNDGVIMGEWKTFANFYNGIVIGAADINNDGKDEIGVTPRQNGGPQILWYSGTGKQISTGFFAYDSAFRGGVRLAGGDINGDGHDEIVVVPGRNRSQGRADLVRYIDVDLSEQTTRVYEYGELIHQFLISSGIARHPTQVGTFSVLRKIYVMDYKWSYGPDNPDNYDLPNVHWNLLFNASEREYLHYAYWHNNFGHPMSHGCINIDRHNSEWLYNWARVGDPVLVHG